jgi:hypothetical protein
MSNPVEFNIPVKLEDGDYCNGCSCLAEFSRATRCQHYKIRIEGGWSTGYIRPDKCKEQFND